MKGEKAMRTIGQGVMLAGCALLMSAAPALAAVQFQCPGYVAGVDADVNGDGKLRAVDPGEISNPVSPRQVCVHLAAGDGFTAMADKSQNGPLGTSQYIFGFVNVTGVPDGDVMKMWDMGGAMLGMTFPAPTLTFNEGDEVYLSLSNVGMMMRPDLFDPHSVHWHGFPNASAIFDGVPDASATINMGATLTYYYNVVEPGTFIYHCHVEAVEHMQMGMLGNLYVAPAQNGTPFGPYTAFAYNDGDGATGYTAGRAYPIQIESFDPRFHDASISVQPLPFAAMKDTFPMLNGRGYPDTINEGNIANEMGYDSQRLPALIRASSGDRILLHMSSLSTTSFHTLTTLGIPMRVVGTGSKILRGEGLSSGIDLSYTTNSVTMGGGQTYDVILDTAGVPAGTYFLYTTNLNHLSNNTEDMGGMMTEIVITEDPV
jgi:FtsP/CotA-like multicopper oxidase with cupredoxin domain